MPVTANFLRAYYWRNEFSGCRNCKQGNIYDKQIIQSKARFHAQNIYIQNANESLRMDQ